ncbi:MAG: nucleoside triphosphate pyrophosphohydrolase, partial [Kiritimatiellae bacterium]|nr:nucleoside triphosphate pyrophosphohydrolase [Kiritimatiellia bacterium]
SVVNYCRFLGVDAESALEAANKKFARRFKAVELRAAQKGQRLTEMDLAGMDALWDEVKAAEKHP